MGSASICTAGSPRGSFSAPSSSRRASRCAARGSKTGCSMSILCGRQSRRECARSRSAGPSPPPTAAGRARCARGYRIIHRRGIIRPPRDVVFYDLRSIRQRAKPSAGATEVEMQYIEGMRQLSARELVMLGMNDVAYVKRVVEDGTEAFAVHAADGTRMAVIPNRDLAFAVVRQNDMEPVSVH